MREADEHRARELVGEARVHRAEQRTVAGEVDEHAAAVGPQLLHLVVAEHYVVAELVAERREAL